MGDRDGRKVGVISEPTVNVLNIPSLLGKVKESNNNHNEMLNEDDKNETVSDSQCIMVLLLLFLVVMMTINGYHTGLLEACEELIYESSNSLLNIGMRYRDDITIAVGKISI